MTVKEFYDKIGGGYEDAITQLRKEERIARYIKMFPGDDSFSTLADALKSGDIETAFRGAHTLKGVCANLAFARLRALASDITEDLRGGKDPAHAQQAFPEVEECYRQVIAAIEEFAQSQS